MRRLIMRQNNFDNLLTDNAADTPRQSRRKTRIRLEDLPPYTPPRSVAASAAPRREREIDLFAPAEQPETPIQQPLLPPYTSYWSTTKVQSFISELQVGALIRIVWKSSPFGDVSQWDGLVTHLQQIHGLLQARIDFEGKGVHLFPFSFECNIIYCEMLRGHRFSELPLFTKFTEGLMSPPERVLYSDGGTCKATGASAAAFTVHNGLNPQPDEVHSLYIESSDNNISEYVAFVAALTYISKRIPSMGKHFF